MQHGLLCAIGYVTANCTLKIPSVSLYFNSMWNQSVQSIEIINKVFFEGPHKIPFFFHPIYSFLVLVFGKKGWQYFVKIITRSQ